MTDLDAFATARAFIDAIVWGEHVRVWELFGPDAREHVLRAANRKGMDAVAAERARLGTWSVEESDQFLSSLVRGLRVDLSGVDLDQIHVVDDAETQPDGSVRYRLESTTLLPVELTGGAHWAAGAVHLSLQDSVWRVLRLEPRPPAGPA
jgi:hypothetical protein